MKKSVRQKYFNRELSWIEFNRRVLKEGLDPSVPLLERLKFITIVSSNFDEFFMVRGAALQQQIREGNYPSCPTGMDPAAIWNVVSSRARKMMREQYRCLHDEIFPGLSEQGLKMVKPAECSPEQAAYLEDLFQRNIGPVLTPVRIEAGTTPPFFGNLRLYVVFELQDSTTVEETVPLRAVVQVPRSLERIIYLPDQEGQTTFTLLEDVIVQHARHLFPGYRIVDHLLFRVTRDADMGVNEERDDDFLEAMEEVIAQRERSNVVRVTMVDRSRALRQWIAETLNLTIREVYENPGPLDLKDLFELANLPGFDELKEPQWRPCESPDFPEELSPFAAIRRKDILLYHPYQAYDPVVRLIQTAAEDGKVLAIKMTLYRTSGNSPIIQALEKAAEKGKQVTVFVELKARFDEEKNIGWANRIERAGGIVIYGIARLKVHAKAMLIIRKEDAGVRRYLHLGTGNYNDRTARLYTDISFFTCKEDITFEASQFFNAITGYSVIPHLRKLIIAPQTLKPFLLQLINRERERSSDSAPGLIMAKMNALADKDVIEALYQASQAGVKVVLNVRGVCMLVPGVPGLSENITVFSVVDRYLEHARIFYFHNGGLKEVYCSSADWMTRNLEKRVELMFPVEQPDLKARLIQILQMAEKDSAKSSLLGSDGEYNHKLQKGQEPYRSQKQFWNQAQQELKKGEEINKSEFQTRRKPPRKKS